MTSPPHLEFNAYYHVFNRGVNRENIFLEEKNYGYFINLYVKYIAPIADTFAYCLLRNHIHLLVRIKSREDVEKTLSNQTLRVLKTLRVSQQFSNFFNAYAKSINKSYGRTGSLLQHPFGRRMVQTDSYFLRAVRYIHQNPQKHRFVNDFRDRPYSSYNIMFDKSPTFVKRDEVLEWFGGAPGYDRLHRENLEDVPFAPDDEEKYLDPKT
jgi:putative transposase